MFVKYADHKPVFMPNPITTARTATETPRSMINVFVSAIKQCINNIICLSRNCTSTSKIQMGDSRKSRETRLNIVWANTCAHMPLISS